MADLFNMLTFAGQRGVEYLLSELHAAEGFLDVATSSQNRDIVARNYRHAQDAYETVLRLLPAVTLGAAQQIVIEDKLAVVKSRLAIARSKTQAHGACG